MKAELKMLGNYLCNLGIYAPEEIDSFVMSLTLTIDPVNEAGSNYSYI